MVFLGRVSTLRQIISRSNARLVLFAVSLVSVLIMGSGFIAMRSYAEREILLIANAVSYAVEPAVVFGDREAIRTGMLATAEIDDLNAIEVVGVDGRMLAEWHFAPQGVIARVDRWLGAILWPMPVTRLVAHDGRVLAQVRVFGGAGAIGFYLLLGLLVSVASMMLTVLGPPTCWRAGCRTMWCAR